MPKIYHLFFYVPVENTEEVKEAVFSTGAGKYNNYEACAWQSQGTGQFRPLAGSQPHIGQKDLLEKVPEMRVEMICQKEHLKSAVTALLQAHPYEEVAYGILELVDLDKFT